MRDEGATFSPHFPAKGHRPHASLSLIPAHLDCSRAQRHSDPDSQLQEELSAESTGQFLYLCFGKKATERHLTA